MNVIQGLGNLLSGGSSGQGGNLQVTVVQARKLARKDVMSKSDPYCLLTVGRKHDMPLQNHIGTHYKTTVINNNEDPVWNQSFTLNVKDSENELLRIKVYDYDHMSRNDLIGEVDIPLFSLVNGCPKDEWYQLSPAKGGAVRLILCANGFGNGGHSANVNQMGMGMQAGGMGGMQNMGMQAGGMGGMQGMGMQGGMGMQQGMGMQGMGMQAPMGYPAAPAQGYMQPYPAYPSGGYGGYY